MSGPITNYELGKMLHREYQAEASRYWGQNTTANEKLRLSSTHKLILAISGATLSILLIAQFLSI
jgi:hypothetical protein